jgi:hypothetical protein
VLRVQEEEKLRLAKAREEASDTRINVVLNRISGDGVCQATFLVASPVWYGRGWCGGAV